ncbi:MAG TPA: hypothetical protein DHV77_09650, partial [Erysipelotrichaceae bacterium]|nr:hypothetical protein [Erysipelotrichaceae bacterium]
KIVEAVGKEKMEIPLFELDQNIVDEVTAIADERMKAAISIPGKLERYDAIDALKAEVVASYEEK